MPQIQRPTALPGKYYTIYAVHDTQKLSPIVIYDDGRIMQWQSFGDGGWKNENLESLMNNPEVAPSIKKSIDNVFRSVGNNNPYGYEQGMDKLKNNFPGLYDIVHRNPDMVKDLNDYYSRIKWQKVGQVDQTLNDVSKNARLASPEQQRLQGQAAIGQEAQADTAQENRGLTGLNQYNFYDANKRGFIEYATANGWDPKSVNSQNINWSYDPNATDRTALNNEFSAWAKQQKVDIANNPVAANALWSQFIEQKQKAWDTSSGLQMKNAAWGSYQDQMYKFNSAYQKFLSDPNVPDWQKNEYRKTYGDQINRSSYQTLTGQQQLSNDNDVKTVANADQAGWYKDYTHDDTGVDKYGVPPKVP